MVTHLNAAAAASISSHRSCQSHDHTPQPPQGHVTRRDVTYIPRLIRASVGASLRQRRDQSSFDNDQTASASAALPYNNAHTQSAVGYFASAADAVDSSHTTASSSASWIDSVHVKILLTGTCRQYGSWSVAGRNHRKVIGHTAVTTHRRTSIANSHRRPTRQNSFVDRTMSVRRYVIQITNASA